MHTLHRNAVTFYYKNYASKTPITITEGSTTYETGEMNVTYGTLTECKGNISAARGSVDSNEFGESLSYNKTICLAKTDITEHAILWVDVTPTIVSGDTTTPHDYKVVRIAKSLNGVQIAIKKVEVE